jgi:hypothetical protein
MVLRMTRASQGTLTAVTGFKIKDHGRSAMKKSFYSVGALTLSDHVINE